ncbi:50S ribosomal protein L4 [Alteribacter lacisalsi]|jgi:large subunit ribosomal protein L4|uniref:Large ribosomal subunit protein uL4 n=1 Tax=Alteribacter lacisalsi TaxID=2045244 RepID=A0A2W0HEB8_9BACI|nr:50S ribosomal protein L4 [Alteribacter lacisalsi]PYZ95655.1 50S ribosomal protein L4 [Alteribacter lacisalsi]
MPKVALFNQSGSQVGDIELAESVFGIEPNKSVLHDAVLMQQASQRQGTHAVKGRSDVRGGGKKPWRQKGTGRARHGTIRSPIWVGGGVAFGPTPRSYAYKLPKKVRRLAIKSALSSKVAAEEIRVLEGLSLDAPKTKEMKAVLNGLTAGAKTLVVTAGHDDAVALSTNNLPEVKTITAEGLNVLDVLNYDNLVITQDAVKKVEEVLA